MCTKFIFFIGIVCVVNASVVTITAYVDDVEDQTNSVDNHHMTSVQDCNNQECDQRCRRLQFPGGICVNGRCKCNNFLESEDDVQKQANSVDNISVQDCNNQECDQRCRRLQFPGGICVNGRCKCDNFLESKAFASILEEYISLQRCYSRDCNESCRERHYAGGFCVNGRCNCYRFPNVLVEGRGTTIDAAVFNGNDDLILDVVAEEVVPARKAQDQIKCKPGFCDHLCQFLGFDHGTCINSRCKCDKKD